MSTFQPTGPCPAKIMIVGEAPGEQDIAQRQPFVGYAGQELSRMLSEAGIMRNACFITHVIRIQPPGMDISTLIAAKKSDITPQHLLVRDKFVLPCVRDGLEMLKREIEMCQPNVIIAFGNVALWALTGNWGVVNWRGSMLQCDLPLGLSYKPKVVPTYTPAMILRQWSWRQIAVHDIRRAAGESKTRELYTPDYNAVIRPDYSTVVSTLDQLYTQVQARPGKIAVDIETRAGHTACIGLAWSDHEALCIPLMCLERSDGYWTLAEEAQISYALYQLLTHPNCEVLGQNFSYDAQYFFRHLHFIPNLKRDTMLTQHVLFSNMQKSLDFLSSMYCKFHTYWKDEGKTWGASLNEDQLWLYNCKDAMITFEVDAAQQVVVDQMNLRPVHDFQQELFWPVLDTMNRGLRVDTSRREGFAMTLQDEIAKREQYFIDVLDTPLNPRSGPQMKQLFYGDLGLKPIINRKTGNVSCDDEALQKIAEREPLVKPLVNAISEYRSLGVFFSTFINAPLDVDGRMRCSFNIGGTETYRFSSSQNAFNSGMNLQNIPKGGEGSSGLTLPNVRTLFVPDPGYSFFDIDLSSADLRIVVWESDEPTFKAMLREGLDPYTEIAKEFYHDPSITKKDPRRQTFKSFAHGTNYLGTAKGLAERLGLSVHEAESTQRWYFQKFPKIKAWQDDLKDQVLKRRMVQNVFGYRCYFFDRIEGTIFNQAAAWIPQSTVACIINRAYVNIHKNLKDVQILLQVHDSLAGQYPTHLGNWMVDQIIEQAQIELPYPGDPMTIPVGCQISPISWGDVK